MSNKAWSDEEEQKLIEIYSGENPERDIYTIAEYFKKKPRSVISKLVQLKIYVKPEDAEGDKNKTVKIMLRELENMLNIDIEGTNLNKKANLVTLVEAVERMTQNI